MASIPAYIVDDEPIIQKTLGKLLELENYPVRTFSTAEEYVNATPLGFEHILIVDKNLPGMSGIELISQQREAGHTFESILITGYAEMESAIQAVRLGCYSYIKKPFDFDMLLKDVAGAAERLMTQGKGGPPSSFGVLRQIIGPLSATSMQFASLRRAMEVVKLPERTEDSFDIACANLRGIERLLEEHLIEARLALGGDEIETRSIALLPTLRKVAEALNNLPYWEKRALIWMSTDEVAVLADPGLFQALLTCMMELALDDSNTSEPILLDMDIKAATVTVHFVVQASLGRTEDPQVQKRIDLCNRMAQAQRGEVLVEPYCGTLGVDYSIRLPRAPLAQPALLEAL